MVALITRDQGADVGLNPPCYDTEHPGIVTLCIEVYLSNGVLYSGNDRDQDVRRGLYGQRKVLL
jgi:hypothetical protein